VLFRSRETLSNDDVRVYQVAATLVAGRTGEALASAYEFFASDGEKRAPILFAAIAGEYQLVWECARPGGELPARQRWRERELRGVARRIGRHAARRGFERALRACVASVSTRAGDPRGVVAALASAASPGRDGAPAETTGLSDGRRVR
jgi:hypothetical protein